LILKNFEQSGKSDFFVMIWIVVDITSSVVFHC